MSYKLDTVDNEHNNQTPSNKHLPTKIFSDNSLLKYVALV